VADNSVFAHRPYRGHRVCAREGGLGSRHRRGRTARGRSMMRPPETELTVLVDDVRTFRDGRPALLARTSGEALALFDQLADRRIDHLWLDFELIGDDTAQPVVDHLVRTAAPATQWTSARSTSTPPASARAIKWGWISRRPATPSPSATPPESGGTRTTAPTRRQSRQARPSGRHARSIRPSDHL